MFYHVDQSWLLVFDNTDVDLKDYWPPSSHGSILITTQKQDLAHQAVSDIALEAFDEDQGSELILSLTNSSGQAPSEQATRLSKQISNELGGLPLLLSHVSGFIGTSKCPLADLLSSLQQPSNFKKIWAFDSTTSTTFQYGEPMEKVWALSLRALSANALETLYILAMLDPDGVAEDDLIGDWGGTSTEFLEPQKKFEYVP